MAARAAGGTHRAKQSQLAPDRPEEAPAAGAASAAAAGDQRAKQSQSPPRESDGKHFVGKGLCGMVLQSNGLLCHHRGRRVQKHCSMNS